MCFLGEFFFIFKILENIKMISQENCIDKTFEMF